MSSVEVLVVECMLCPASAKITASHATPDAIAKKWFEKLGWTVQPTRCPAHVGMDCQLRLL